MAKRVMPNRECPLRVKTQEIITQLNKWKNLHRIQQKNKKNHHPRRRTTRYHSWFGKNVLFFKQKNKLFFPKQNFFSYVFKKGHYFSHFLRQISYFLVAHNIQSQNVRIVQLVWNCKTQRRNGTSQHILSSQLSIKSLFEKVKLRQVSVNGSPTRKFDMSIMSFLVTLFFCLKNFQTEQRENSQVPAKQRPFLIVHTRGLDFLDNATK